MQFGPKFYFATLTDHRGNKKYMTVCNLFIDVINDNIEDSVIIKEDGYFEEEETHLLCSASFCVVSDQPIFQFQ